MTQREPGPLDDLAAIDEMLEVMFWMHGEGLASEIEARDLTRFVAIDEDEIARLLETLAKRGSVVRTETGGLMRYRLTDIGRQEAGRRFADEFADMVRPGHGQCGDPDCECQRTGSAADCSHLRGGR